MAEVNKYSQGGEEIEIARIFKVLGVEKGRLADLGAGDGYALSNTRRLIENGWTGVLLDGDPRGASDVDKVWITKDTIVLELIKRIASINFLNIDLDGNDYHILEAVLESCSPDLIVAEYNPIFQRDEAVVMPYNPDHVWNNDTYYGMSLAACEQVGKRFGYTLIHLHGGINAFLLRDDHAKAHPELVGTINYAIKYGHKPHDPSKEWLRL